MGAGNNGYILVHRKLRDNWLWQAKVFTRAQAWLDLIMWASYRDRRVRFQGAVHELRRGELVTSQRVLAKRWGWSTTRVRRFLQDLAQDRAISVTKKNQSHTHVTICNYEAYQLPSTSEKPVKNQSQTSRKPRKNESSNTVNKHYLEGARRLLDFLNRTANRSFRPTPTNLGFISARLKEGATEQECRAVISRKCQQWATDERLYTYLRPATLFNRTKFWSYHGELGARPQPPTWQGDDPQ